MIQPGPAATRWPVRLRDMTDTPDTIIPDTKDWTWVLRRPCPECGFDTSAFSRDEVATLLRDNAAQWEPVLRRPDVRQRPEPAVWSPLEYACHVRDVFTLYDHRLGLMLTQDDPLYPNWDQDETAVAGRYGEQDPEQVLAELRAAAGALAAHFDLVAGRAVGAAGPAQRRRGLHGRDVRPVLHPRPGAPPARRHRLTPPVRRFGWRIDRDAGSSADRWRRCRRRGTKNI